VRDRQPYDEGRDSADITLSLADTSDPKKPEAERTFKITAPKDSFAGEITTSSRWPYSHLILASDSPQLRRWNGQPLSSAFRLGIAS